MFKVFIEDNSFLLIRLVSTHFFPDFCHSRVYAVELASRRFVRMEDWFCANLCVDRNWGYFLLSTGQISRQRFSRQGFDISVHLRLRILKYLRCILLERNDSPVCRERMGAK